MTVQDIPTVVCECKTATADICTFRDVLHPQTVYPREFGIPNPYFLDNMASSNRINRDNFTCLKCDIVIRIFYRLRFCAKFLTN